MGVKAPIKARLLHGDYIAELYSADPVFIYIVTRQDDREIIAMGQSRTVKAAEREALHAIKSLRRQSARAKHA